MTIDPSEASTVEIQYDPVFSLNWFVRSIRKFGFCFQDTLETATTESRAHELARHLLPNATEGDHEQFVANFLALIKQCDTSMYGRPSESKEN